MFIGIYVYGWNRLSPRAHSASGIPIVIARLTGSLFVLSVNSWMNDPGGFELRDGRVTDMDPVEALFGNSHLGYSSSTCTSPASSSPASLRRRLRGRAPAGELGPLRADRADDGDSPWPHAIGVAGLAAFMVLGLAALAGEDARE